MKRALSAVAIILLMVVSYVVGRRHPVQNDSAASTSRPVLYWVDPMHPDYKSDHPGIAPDCGMALEPVYGGTIASAVSSPSSAHKAEGDFGIDTEKQELFGIRVATVSRTSGAEKIRALGRVVPEDTRIYRVTAGSDGFIRETFQDSIGVQVKKDQKLATSYIGETLAVASGFLAATAGVAGAAGKDGARTMPYPGAVNKQGVSSVQGYTDRLRNLGVSETQIRQMAESRQLPETVDIVSPADGFILARSITPGQHFDRSAEFYRIADLSQVWIVAEILGIDAQNIRPGTVVRVNLSDQGKTFSARVSDVLPQVDPATRTLKLRLDADNPGFALRPDMFVNVELPVRAPSGLSVPADALIDSGRMQRVYIERSNGVFEPRQVQIGRRFADRVEIVSGLAEGERVVVAGTFLVDSESRLKNRTQVEPGPQRHENTAPHHGNMSNLSARSNEANSPQRRP